MICDVIIIKDGLPLYSSNFSSSSNIRNLISQEDNLIMISGFFSALNSFSDSFDDLGTISELKLSNNNLKLSFLKDSNIPDLIYLATYDKSSELIDVQRFLKKISHKFLKEFNIEQISNWNGKLNYFKSFDVILKQYFEEEIRKNEFQDRNKAFEFLNSFIEEDIKSIKPKTDTEIINESPEYYYYIPTFISSKKINPKYYLTGDNSCRVYEQINGKKSIDQIAISLNLNQNQVYNVCKNLIKMGFISFN
ncbi:MAG: hypothetical protein JSV23_04915 [Promethearchaeota archaeon]|nr:MAG: hypothetical protein JSV23_04915 [Candidatus Lokiarchaeota archaeon]